MFDLHASTAPLDDALSLDSSASLPSVSSQAHFSTGTSLTQLSQDVPFNMESLSISISSIPDAPQTTPQSSLPPSLSHPLQASPAKIAHAAGVKGSAIRSFLLTMQGNAASHSAGDDSSIEAAFHQQRASAVELIRQRSALN
jgi:hypothetical protein